ncbi:MAG: acetyl-CoA synthase, partial [Thermodesulfobacteriota bacterium]|nr:acetyl-CoA synthase [Thermodesulfobacteriota bacterium]
KAKAEAEKKAEAEARAKREEEEKALRQKRAAERAKLAEKRKPTVKSTIKKSASDEQMSDLDIIIVNLSRMHKR